MTRQTIALVAAGAFACTVLAVGSTMAHGPQFIAQAQPTDNPTPQQLTRRACFAQAKAAHSAIPPTAFWDGQRTTWRRVPDWPSFWRQWLIDHPECSA